MEQAAGDSGAQNIHSPQLWVAFLVAIGAKIVHPPQDDAYAPGYYSVLFEDPDGVRLELNHVPGRGVFDTPSGKVYGSLD